ncbi:heat shock protein beta-9 [Tupaia chinensis]|uniref:Heat shock protein beta-9 n=1 Tax=Tupaia chinensis TaxID=246437 RepID=L9JWV2_TUPCH|nr:heat shock protein beta-9 [Tupaia chinensis]ELW54966.1 Heat shock protein beta-9 [Tupaia chinensis]
MQRVGSSFSESGVSSRRPSVALAEQNQVATLPVRLLRDQPAAVLDDSHVENGFQVKMDAHGFTPEELVVRVDGQRLVVTGQRRLEGCDPERGRYHMSQKVHRQMRLPPDLDPTAMTCCLTPSGQLWVRSQCGVALPPPEAQTCLSPRFRSHSSKASNLA